MLRKAMRGAENRISMSWSEQVQSTLHQMVLGGTASGAAGASGIHERTLRRRLAAGGKSLQQVANRTRFELAQQVLGNTDLSVAQIAKALHCEDPDAFSQSFRAWAGNSPRQLRQA